MGSPERTSQPVNKRGEFLNQYTGSTHADLTSNSKFASPNIDNKSALQK